MTSVTDILKMANQIEQALEKGMPNSMRPEGADKSYHIKDAFNPKPEMYADKFGRVNDMTRPKEGPKTKMGMRTGVADSANKKKVKEDLQTAKVVDDSMGSTFEEKKASLDKAMVDKSISQMDYSVQLIELMKARKIAVPKRVGAEGPETDTKAVNGKEAVPQYGEAREAEEEEKEGLAKVPYHPVRDMNSTRRLPFPTNVAKKALADGKISNLEFCDAIIEIMKDMAEIRPPRPRNPATNQWHKRGESAHAIKPVGNRVAPYGDVEAPGQKVYDPNSGEGYGREFAQDEAKKKQVYHPVTNPDKKVSPKVGGWNRVNSPTENKKYEEQEKIDADRDWPDDGGDNYADQYAAKAARHGVR